jgi:hypothetical protein
MGFQVPGSCSRLRIGLSNWYYLYPVVQAFLFIVLTELDSHSRIPESTNRIYSSAMKDDYSEVFAAFKGRGRALPASNLAVSIVFKWVNIRVCLAFGKRSKHLAVGVKLALIPCGTQLSIWSFTVACI